MYMSGDSFSSITDKEYFELIYTTAINWAEGRKKTI